MTEFSFSLDSIACGGCAIAITESLSALAGVSDVRVQINAKTVSILGDDVSPSQVEQSLLNLKQTHRHWCFHHARQKLRKAQRLGAMGA